jgi:RNA polymerase sigma factor (sigma-70 family)
MGCSAIREGRPASYGATVYLVDDDPSMRQVLTLALGTEGYTVVSCDSASAFFAACPARDEAGCVVLDLKMPDMDGLELHQAVKDRGCPLPVIFMSAAGSVEASVRALKQGALDFLEKPFPLRVLIARVDEALEADRARRAEEETRRQIGERFDRLTAREREVMQLVVNGLSNKEVAKVLSISPRTVENHRAQMMAKMLAGNVAELCQLAALCPVPIRPALPNWPEADARR